MYLYCSVQYSTCICTVLYSTAPVPVPVLYCTVQHMYCGCHAQYSFIEPADCPDTTGAAGLDSRHSCTRLIQPLWSAGCARSTPDMYNQRWPQWYPRDTSRGNQEMALEVLLDRYTQRYPQRGTLRVGPRVGLLISRIFSRDNFQSWTMFADDYQLLAVIATNICDYRD